MSTVAFSNSEKQEISAIQISVKLPIEPYTFAIQVPRDEEIGSIKNYIAQAIDWDPDILRISLVDTLKHTLILSEDKPLSHYLITLGKSPTFMVEFVLKN